MKLISKFTLLAGALLGMIATVASAEPIVASVSIGSNNVNVTTASNGAGGYIYTSLGTTNGTITANNASNSSGITTANSTVTPYFATGNAIVFGAAPNFNIPTPTAGVSGTVAGSTSTSGGSQLFTTTGTGGASLTFYITSYSVITNFAGNSAGTTGAFLLMGNGYFVESATGRTFTNTAASYSLSLSGNGSLSFSANGITTVAPTPEPSSLILLGTGLMGAAGVAFRRRRAIA